MTDQSTEINPETAPESAVAPDAEVPTEPTVGEALAAALAFELAAPSLASPAASAPYEPESEPDESFADLLAQFEKTHKHRTEAGPTLQGTVVSLTPENVLLDVGYKIEGAL
ncbi:MAG: hypothetical protein WCF17_13140, partial [Terracidiphilus sp.]